MFAMSAYWYEQWYKNKVSPNLSRQEKLNLIRRISDLSLREPIFHGGLHYSKKDWPELAAYSSTDEITGVQLYTVLMAASQELGFPTTLGSTYQGKPIMPDLPSKTKRYIGRTKPESFVFKKKPKTTGGQAKIGTDTVPSVENRAGCDLIDGKWFDSYGICVLSDGRIQGYTAPVKGVYFYWSKGGKDTEMTESVGACHVYGDDYYPRGIGTCHSKIDLKLPKSALKDPRRAMLQIASNVMKGKTEGLGIMCSSPRGRPVGCSARNAIVGNNPGQVRKLYENVRLEHVKPFRFRRDGYQKN